MLPGTAFRHEAKELGLTFQPRPPYYVRRTPTLDAAAMFGLMQEAQDTFGTEFDAPDPVLDFGPDEPYRVWRVDLDAAPTPAPNAAIRAQAFTLWLRAADFRTHAPKMEALIREVLRRQPVHDVATCSGTDRFSECGTGSAIAHAGTAWPVAVGLSGDPDVPG